MTKLQEAFCCYLLAWKQTGKFEIFAEVDGDGVLVTKICEQLKHDHTAMPAAVAAAFDVRSYADAVCLVDKALDAPLVEDEAEQELLNLKMSEFCEQLNAARPDLPQLPVVYPKHTRRWQ
jgi:hypothetical protein